MSSSESALTAAGVRARNAELDRALRTLISAVSPEEIHAPPRFTEWSLAENLGHLAEFPRFFAAQLRDFVGQRSTPIGRTHDHDDRMAAVAAARDRSLEELTAECDAAFDELASALELLDDDAVAATTNNVKYGDEPLTAFLDRYVLGHKEAHLRQLAETLTAVRGERG